MTTSKLDCRRQKVKRRLIDSFNGKRRPTEWKPSGKNHSPRKGRANWVEIALSKPANIHV